MAAYVIGEIEVTDPAGYDEYRKGVLATIEKFGGRFAARGGRVEPLEGGWSPKRLGVVGFPPPRQGQKGDPSGGPPPDARAGAEVVPLGRLRAAHQAAAEGLARAPGARGRRLAKKKGRP